jgi:hypothetical protein
VRAARGVAHDLLGGGRAEECGCYGVGELGEEPCLWRKARGTGQSEILSAARGNRGGVVILTCSWLRTLRTPGSVECRPSPQYTQLRRNEP